jgi:hypothetical protein
MIEQGFVQYVQAGLTAASVTVPGGFFNQIPENQLASFTGCTINQAWVYKTIFKTPTYILNGQVSLTKWEVQIDCHGTTGDYALSLAYAIQNVLRGSFRGTFSDPDSTKVEGIFQLPNAVSGINDISRTFVQSLEYDVFYYQV